MVKIINASASFLNSTKFIDISFDIENTYEDLNNYRFELFKSFVEFNKFSLICSDIQNFNFKDYDVNLRNSEIKYFYKIKAINLKDGSESWSELIDGVYKEEDVHTKAIRSIYNKYLKVIGRTSMILLKKIKSGTLCDCYDDIRGGSRKSQSCEKCYGVGYVGGYHKPTTILVNFQNYSGISENFSPKGVFEKETLIQAWTENYPLIQKGDIVIDQETANRYLVVNWQPSYKDEFLIRQTISLDKLPEANNIYNLAVTED